MFNFFRPSVDSLLSDIAKIGEKLDRRAQDASEDAASARERAQRIEQRAASLDAEGDRASRIAERIRNLLS